MDIFKMSNSEKKKKSFFGPIFGMQLVTDMLTMLILDDIFVTARKILSPNFQVAALKTH